MIKPTIIAKAKNASVLSSTQSGFDSGFLNPITKVSTKIPITSSMIAALRIVVPSSVLSLPISFRASTVMLTLVAVIITPMNTAVKNFSEPHGAKP